MQRLLTTLLLLLTAPGLAFAQNVVEVTRAISGDVTWTSDNTYVLVGRIFVDDGADLHGGPQSSVWVCGLRPAARGRLRLATRQVARDRRRDRLAGL